MKLTEDIIKEMLNHGIEDTWTDFNMFNNPDDYEDDEGYENYQELQQKIWHGFDVKFSIFDLWEEGRIIIKGDDVIFMPKRKVINIEDFRGEKLKRISEMRRFIMANAEIPTMMEDR